MLWTEVDNVRFYVKLKVHALKLIQFFSARKYIDLSVDLNDKGEKICISDILFRKIPPSPLHKVNVIWDNS